MMPQESTLQEEDLVVEFKATTESNKRKRESLYWKHMERVYTKDANSKLSIQLVFVFIAKRG